MFLALLIRMDGLGVGSDSGPFLLAQSGRRLRKALFFRSQTFNCVLWVMPKELMGSWFLFVHLRLVGIHKVCLYGYTVIRFKLVESVEIQ